ncbi:MAG TPA: UDP-N-acetylmuramoyl-L-alanyl-D-glutamate--2,6-diaminopimelate ligase [Microthrixaceae bacterium]|nr:UDP-N-acetylmuramoyl-L-alanyl-D-glutamate--2,6-diaminopimelate ligase [Microthrixaceae bacterium]
MKLIRRSSEPGASESAEADVLDVTHNSASVSPGALFCCVPGATRDGHDFAADAVNSGAVALLCERPLGLGVPEILCDDVRVAMAEAAALVWGRPSEGLHMVGVTGTNGKTTVVTLVTGVLARAGIEARSIGTLTGERTTPEATDLQRDLARMVAEGATHVAIEVSSHALVQHRVDQVRFDIAVFTNLGNDHMDFHQTPEAYFAAKARLFEPDMSDMGIVCVDDVHGRLLYDASGATFKAVSIEDARDLHGDGAGSRFTWRDNQIDLPLVGRYNVIDSLLAAEACVQLGVSPSVVASALGVADVVPGRFETFRTASGSGVDVSVVVDYAHTPDALESALEAAREVTPVGGTLTVVFGCGGDRDRSKRPMMGAVAARLSDRVILTNDNPRSNDPAEIISEILAGITVELAENPELSIESEVVPDRREAIAHAIAEARDGDVVLVAGKGHERGQIFADRVEPFDDREVVRELLEIRDQT